MKIDKTNLITAIVLAVTLVLALSLTLVVEQDIPNQEQRILVLPKRQTLALASRSAGTSILRQLCQEKVNEREAPNQRKASQPSPESLARACI